MRGRAAGDRRQQRCRARAHRAGQRRRHARPARRHRSSWPSSKKCMSFAAAVGWRRWRPETGPGGERRAHTAGREGVRVGEKKRRAAFETRVMEVTPDLARGMLSRKRCAWAGCTAGAHGDLPAGWVNLLTWWSPRPEPHATILKVAQRSQRDAVLCAVHAKELEDFSHRQAAVFWRRSGGQGLDPHHHHGRPGAGCGSPLLVAAVLCSGIRVATCNW